MTGAVGGVCEVEETGVSLPTVGYSWGPGHRSLSVTRSETRAATPMFPLTLSVMTSVVSSLVEERDGRRLETERRP